MDLMVERCAGMEFGKDEVVACVRTPDPSGNGCRKETRTFMSFTSQLEHGMLRGSSRPLSPSAS